MNHAPAVPMRLRVLRADPELDGPHGLAYSTGRPGRIGTLHACTTAESAPEPMTVEVATTVQAMEAIVPEWRALAGAVAEPNPFYEPFLLLPAVANLAGERGVQVLLARDQDGQLTGLFPLQWRAFSSSVPVPHYSLWKHPYCYLCTPLLRVGCEEVAVAAFLEWLDGAGRSGLLLRLGPHVAGGPFDRALHAEAVKRGDSVRTTREYERPMVVAHGAHEQYYQDTVPRKRRKQLRRLRNRLDEQGTVAFHTFTSGDDVAAWIPRFIDLEHHGWKGREGTSFASSESDRRFLVTGAAGGASQAQVEVRAMTLDNLPIAMAITFRSGSGAFAFKIAYDEAHADWSPGVQLDLHMFHETFADPTVDWVDSCADPNFPMLDSLWGERRPIRLAELVRGSRTGALVGWSATQAQALTAAARARISALDPEVQRQLRRLVRMVRP